MYFQRYPHSLWPGWRHACAVLLLALLVYPCMPAFAAEATQEYELKAALIYKLTRFVSWPERAAETGLTLCVAGKNPFGSALDRLQGQKSNQRPLTVKYLASGDKNDTCQVVFIPNSARDSLAAMLANALTRPVLTLSDGHGFAKAGGMIEITRRNSRLSFVINMRTVTLSGLQVATPLLQIATLIEQPGKSNE